MDLELWVQMFVLGCFRVLVKHMFVLEMRFALKSYHLCRSVPFSQRRVQGTNGFLVLACFTVIVWMHLFFWDLFELKLSLNLDPHT